MSVKIESVRIAKQVIEIHSPSGLEGYAHQHNDGTVCLFNAQKVKLQVWRNSSLTKLVGWFEAECMPQ